MNFKQDIIAHTFRNKYLKYTGGSYTTSKASSTTDYAATQIANWFYEDDNGNLHSRLSFVGDKEISAYGVGDDSGTGSITIIDNLLSNAVDCALSANQGRVLNEKIEDIIEQGVGGVTSWDDLEDKPALLTDENIQKWNTQTHTHSNKTVLDAITSDNISNWNTAYTNNHTHSNKSVLDGITSTNVSNWDTVYNDWNKAFYFDDDNNLRVKLNLVGEGEVSAYGAGTSGGSGVITIVDNLTSTATDCALSANQGRVLKNLIDNIDVSGGGLDSVNVTGSGNAVTNASLSNNILTLTKGNTFALSEHTHTKSGYSWTAKYKINNWSRIMTINGYANVLLSINFAQSSQASNHLYLISCGHTSANIIQLGANNYNTNYNVKVRVSESDAKTHNVEVYGTYNYSGATDISIDCNYVKFENISTVTTYNTYTAGGGTSRKEITSSYNKIVADLAGNADSATKLQTSRTLWGQSFDGTSNVNGNINTTGVFITTNNTVLQKTGYANTNIITAGWNSTNGDYVRYDIPGNNDNSKYMILGSNTGLSFTGNITANKFISNTLYTTALNAANVFVSGNAIYDTSDSDVVVAGGNCRPIIRWGERNNNGWRTRYLISSAREDNNSWGRLFMAVSNSDAGTSVGCSFSLYGAGYAKVEGNLQATGEITAYSDERLKSNIKRLTNRGYITPVTYVKDGKESIGFIAQDVQKLYPELVTNGEYLSLNYAQYTAVLQAQIIELNNRIKQLESKL